MSTYYKERERDRDWDVGSDHGSRASYTVRRYKVPDKREDDFEADIKISKRESGSRDNRSTYRSDFRSRDSREYDDYRFSRESHRAPSPPEVSREVRIERDLVRDAPRRDRDEFDVDRYTRTTEYFRDDRPPQQPQPIVIRNDAPAPIIIREQAAAPIVIREERPTQLEVVDRTRDVSTARSEAKSERRTEVNEERSVAKRDDSPEEDYYYERRVRKIKREDDRQEEDREDRDDNRSLRRGRSVGRSQYDNNRVDEDEIHYRRVEEYDDYRDSSPHHRRHLAEGAIAGLGAAALLRDRNQKEGKSGGGKGRLVAGAGLGAVGAELISRYRRERSKSRGRVERDREEEREEEGETSLPHLGTWGKVGAVAAVGALAGYALSKNKKAVRSRSRGRGRSGSRGRSRSASRARSRGVSRSASRGVSRGRDRSRDRSAGGSRSSSVDSHSARNPAHQKKVIAGAGLATAALTGLYGQIRGKSQGGRSKSKVRQAAPAVAAGIGGAALAGLYEKHKAKKERQEEEESSRTRRRARSKSRSRGHVDDEGAEDGLVQYGDSPISRDAQNRRPVSRGDSTYHADSPDGGHYGYDEPGREAHEAAERRQAEMDRHDQGYNFGPYAEAPPPAANYPQTPYFPQQQNNGFDNNNNNNNNFVHPQNAYAPVPQFMNMPQQQQQQQQDHAHFDNQPPMAPPNPDYYNSQQTPPNYGADRYGHGGTNVSNHPEFSYTHGRSGPHDVEVNSTLLSGSTNRTRSRSVHFENPNELVDSDDGGAQPDTTHNHVRSRSRDGRHHHDDEENDDDDHVTHYDSDDDNNDRRNNRDEASQSRQRRHHHHRRRRRRSDRDRAQREDDNRDGEEESDSTIELPDRFDSKGRKKSDRSNDGPASGGFASRLLSKLSRVGSKKEQQ